MDPDEWLDRSTGIIRDGLSAHMGIERRSNKLAWIIHTEQALRQYALRRWDALMSLHGARSHLVSLFPILHLLDEAKGAEAAMLFRLRLGPWLTERMERDARFMRIGDADGVAADCVDHVAEQLARRVGRDHHDPRRPGAQPRFVRWVKTCGKRKLLDRKRDLARHVLAEADIPTGSSAEQNIDIAIAKKTLTKWEDSLPANVSAAYTAWMQPVGKGNAWHRIAASSPHACSRSTFYRHLTELGQMLHEGGVKPQTAKNPKAEHLRLLKVWRPK